MELGGSRDEGDAESPRQGELRDVEVGVPPDGERMSMFFLYLPALPVMHSMRACVCSARESSCRISSAGKEGPPFLIQGAVHAHVPHFFMR